MSVKKFEDEFEELNERIRCDIESTARSVKAVWIAAWIVCGLFVVLLGLGIAVVIRLFMLI